MDAIELLKSHQLKKTAPRVAIINALIAGQMPQSEAEIKSKIGALYDRITFYRSVHSLLEVGLIHKIVVDNLLVKYALNNCANGHAHEVNHIHFYCKTCSKVMCMEEVKIMPYVLPQGYSKNECDVVIKGCCGCCEKFVLGKHEN
jgi:Fur family transcriptional regulator, ferric uptake regulator